MRRRKWLAELECSNGKADGGVRRDSAEHEVGRMTCGTQPTWDQMPVGSCPGLGADDVTAASRGRGGAHGLGRWGLRPRNQGV
jgi:hypothetical protein